METGFDFIGEANYDVGNNSKFTTKNNFRVNKGQDNIFQILPPFGLLAKTGRWFSFEESHWGYTNSEGKKRPFGCIERRNRKTKMIEQECPQCTKISEITLRRDEIKSRLKKENKSIDESNKALEPLNDWLFTFNKNRQFKLNVRAQDGRIGRLFIKIKHMQALKLFIKELIDGRIIKGQSIDPIVKGLFINFTKAGEGRETIFSCTPVYEDVMINGKTYQELKMEPLSSEVLQKMKTEAAELSLGATELTFDQIDQLVKSGGDPKIVDSVFGMPKVSDMEFPQKEDESSSEDFSDETGGVPSEDRFANLFGKI